jgi:hypothetical protein
MGTSRAQDVEKDPFGLDPVMDLFGPGALSDEYDLCESFQAYLVVRSLGLWYSA